MLTADDLPFPVTRLQPVTGGHLHTTYRAETPDGPLFLKLYTGPDWPLSQVLPTLRVQQHLWQAGHPVPRIAWEPLALEGGVLVAMTFLEGARIDQPGPVEAAAAGRALGRIHRDLQDMPLPSDPVVPETGAIARRAQALLEAAATGPGDAMDRLAAEAAQFRLRWLERHPIDPSLYARARAQVVHGDYYPGNLLYRAPHQLSGIVDFDFASVRFRGLEVARAVVESALRPDGRFDADVARSFLRAYLRENALPDEERRTAFRIWLEYLLGSLYPLPLRYEDRPLPHGWERLAERRHALLLWLADHLADLERLAATI